MYKILRVLGSPDLNARAFIYIGQTTIKKARQKPYLFLSFRTERYAFPFVVLVHLAAVWNERESLAPKQEGAYFDIDCSLVAF